MVCEMCALKCCDASGGEWCAVRCGLLWNGVVWNGIEWYAMWGVALCGARYGRKLSY